MSSEAGAIAAEAALPSAPDAPAAEVAVPATANAPAVQAVVPSTADATAASTALPSEADASAQVGDTCGDVCIVQMSAVHTVAHAQNRRFS